MRVDAALNEGLEGSYAVFDLGGVRVLGCPAVVKDEGDDPDRLGNVAASLRWLDADPTAKPPPWV